MKPQAIRSVLLALGLAALVPNGLRAAAGTKTDKTPSAAETDARPNVVLFFADDLSCMDIGANNPETFYETPNTDALAAQGIVWIKTETQARLKLRLEAQ